MKPEILQIAPMLPQRRGGARRGLRRAPLLGGGGPRRRSSPRPARASAAWRPTGTTGSRREIMAALPKLEIVASYGVGYDNIDTAACKARGVRASNTPDVLNDAVAELALGADARRSAGACRRRTPSSARASGSNGGFGAHRRADRRARRHPRARPHRQGDRPAPAGDEDARLLPRPPASSPTSPTSSIPTSRPWPATSTGWSSSRPAPPRRAASSRAGCSRPSARRAPSSTSPAAALVDEPALVELLLERPPRRRRARRLRRRAARAGGAPRACPTSSSRRTRARRRGRPAPPWAISWCATSPRTSPATRSSPRSPRHAPPRINWNPAKGSAYTSP